MERAIFAGGCFWCMVQPFDSLPGIYSVTSGYTGGHVAHPTYEQVCTQKTGPTSNRTKKDQIEQGWQTIRYRRHSGHPSERESYRFN